MKTSNRIRVSLVLIFAFGISYAQPPERVPVTLQTISGSLYEIKGGRGANGGLYIGDNGVLVIDTKMDEISVNETIEAIRKITDKPVKFIVNTHSDGDHINGNRYFPATATIIAHENCRKDLFLPKRDGSPSDWNSPEMMPYIPSVTFQDKMDIYLGSKKAELWYFGTGHTTGDAVVYIPEEKTAFIGDQLFITRPQLIHSHKGGNSFEHVRTLSRMLETIEAENFCSGHDEMSNRQEIQEHITNMQEKQQKVKSLLKQHQNLDEIKSRFEKNEGRLIEVIYDELTEAK